MSAAIDDDALVAAIRLASRPAYGNRWVVPAVQVELIRWVAAVYERMALV